MAAEGRPLTTAGELVDFMDSNDMLMHLTIQEAEVVLNYLEGHGYALEDRDGKLMRLDLSSDPEEPEREETFIDDVIDTVCEWNYELIQEAKAARDNPEDFLDFAKKEEHYNSLREDEKILDPLFDRTKYGKEIIELAEKLADEFIRNMESRKGTEEAVRSVSEGITRYRTDKKGMVR